MAYTIVNNTQTKVTGIAGADLTTSQYLFVKQNAAGLIVPVTSITDIPLGVLQNAPRVTEECEIIVGGGTKLVAGASLATAAAPLLGTDATGKAVPVTPGTSTTQYQLGRALTFPGTANTELFTGLIECSSPGRAA